MNRVARVATAGAPLVPARDWRFWLLLAALLALLAALLAPRVALTRPARDILLVIDVTGSMNVRDYATGGAPQTRLAAAKQATRGLLAGLPCQSRLGLGIFTERRSFMLFEPAEVCGNFAAIDGAIDGLDWRMAWEGDSYVTSGVHSALAMAAGLKSDLVFMTDGQEAPPLAGGRLPAFDGKPGEVAGLLVGVGRTDPSPIPKFDQDGREVGFYGEQDVPQENRSGPPPEDAPSRAGWNPRNAPWGGEPATGTEHLSAMREEHLRALATQTGLGFAPLDGAPALIAAVEADTSARPVVTRIDTAAVPAALALFCLCVLFGLGAVSSRRPDRLPVQ
ncbi:von Willebrand factor type A [Ancylobacter novellus DSM 506]|uniref:von Willebrand factor type A n=1 Tax=Ancylobacter novellus (strain ATCC 8093 / DSM 506 / JCM 20403 / CCM 1077 / IAM 12100 / NBRC 12443 / NCIMB 10456) TaxID=639283 RepID=D7A1P1_ANCN5|nr:vWA domain-containing protein [Ancylobacter novellus]ADH91466.1 von Willebrand factor type A [Ancylobacter novellus DSM 506]